MITQRLLARISLPLLLLIIVHTAFAQKVISGRVTDSKDGSPVIGATVQPKGGTGGTSTGTDGSFRLTVGNDVNTLVVSSVGFGTMEISISGKTSVDVSLTSSTKNDLNEVVVVGYGTARKKDLTGAVTSVKAKDFNRGIVTAPDQLIQGKVPGVQVVNNSGAPGGATTVRIRGNSSIRTGNQPLYVIDGVQLDGRGARPGFDQGQFGATPSANPLNFINPNDIASIDVLKDASATAIYGSRGANGVVIVTTKRGLSGAPRIEFNTSGGFSKILKSYDVLDASEFRAALKLYGVTTGDYGANVDAMDAITRTGFTQNYNVSMSGGTEGGRYRVSLGHVNQQGIIKNSDFKKYVANISGQFKFLESKRLGLDFNLIAAQNAEQIAPISNDAGFEGSLIGQALQWNPTHPLRNPDGTIWVKTPLGNTTINPLAMLEAYDDRSRITEILASIAPSFKILNELEYKFTYGINYGTGNRRASLASWLNLTGVEGRGIGFVGNQERNSQMFTHTLNYQKQITPKFNLNVLGGYEFQKFNFKGYGLAGRDFQTQDLDYTYIFQNSSVSSRNTFGYIDPTVELQSYFGRAIINLKDKYLLTATMRADGSSKFGENNKYGYFPSVGFAWNVTNEEFMKDAAFVNNLKLRLSWGKTGNQEFPAGAATERYSLGINGPGTLGQTNVANPDLKWETSTTVNAGIDFSLMSDRLFGSIDYFRKSTEDLLFQFNAIQPAPATRYWINLPGTVVNQGVEVGLNAVLARTKDINWSLGVFASFLKNELTDFPGPNVLTGGLHGQGSTGTNVQRVAEGQPLNVFYTRRFLGIDKTTGNSLYQDDGNTLFYVGNPNPTTLLGISTEFNYKKLVVSVNMNGAFGHDVYNNTLMSVIPISSFKRGLNTASSLINASQKENLDNAITASSRYIEKGDYMKLANATVSYSIGNIGNAIKGLTVFVTGQNLFVITNYSGFDPEVNTDKQVDGFASFGIEYVPYPSARSILFGINFSL
jgi:TonB-dependent starch-binding outer membrane protein SusC